MALIGFITNVSFYGRLSASFASPAANRLGPLVVAVPALGGLVIGLMARFGSESIRGDGIPEVIERVLTQQSRIHPSVTFLKPLSAAIAIGTGCPFGAEGPIIATGGALGSLIGQFLHTTANERKLLLSAGAAAGIAGIFGCPVAAVLFAMELLLFEFSARSLIATALASASAAAVRIAFTGFTPIFAMPALPALSGAALGSYIVLGAAVGVAAVWVNRLIFALEDGFERLPVHWMWWPALGGVAVGLIGWASPRTLGVGYDNISEILSGRIAGAALVALCLLKLASWSIALGSGTSGGTLAPLFTIGGALGGILGTGVAVLWPGSGVDPRMAALVGMAALFAGSSRAFLASVIFAFEATMQTSGLLPLLGGCAAAHFVSCWMDPHGIMTHKIARKGVRVPAEFSADVMSRLHVRDVALRAVSVLRTQDTVSEALGWLRSGEKDGVHQGFPVVDEEGRLTGVVTRRDLERHAAEPSRPVGAILSRPPVSVFDDDSLHDAIDLMLTHDVGRLPVVSRSAPRKVVGFLTRSSVLSAYRRHFDDHRAAERHLVFGLRRKAAPKTP